MTDTSSATLVRPAAPLFDEARIAVAGFLARYSGGTRVAYSSDLRMWLTWCANHGLNVLDAQRPHLELWARDMEEHQLLARATIGRRLSTVAGLYRFAVIDGKLERSPADYVRRPHISGESTTLGLDRMELGALIAQAAAAGPTDHALACRSGCWGCGWVRRAPSTSRTSTPPAGTAP
jgi:site-specific recombinase XerD